MIIISYWEDEYEDDDDWVACFHECDENCSWYGCSHSHCFACGGCQCAGYCDDYQTYNLRPGETGGNPDHYKDDE